MQLVRPLYEWLTFSRNTKVRYFPFATLPAALRTESTLQSW